MPRIAVTGSTGFLGSRLVEALLDEGQEVRGLVRPGSAERPRSGAEYVRGDVRNGEVMAGLVEGCDAVVHLASSFSALDDIESIVVEGTRSVLEAAREAGVGRFVQVSCLGAQAASPSPLLRSKWKADSYVRGSQVPWVILRPSVILGRHDIVVEGVADLVRALPLTPVPGRGESRFQPVDVDDVVRCITAALSSESVLGEEISIGGPSFLTYRQLVDLVSDSLDIFHPKVLVPERWLPALQRLLPVAGRALFAPARLTLLEQGVVASPGIVPRHFGFEPGSVVRRLPAYLA